VTQRLTEEERDAHRERQIQKRSDREMYKKERERGWREGEKERRERETKRWGGIENDRDRQRDTHSERQR